ncbi:MAG: Crp/Fnr family transcriptional regulator [Bacteroidetes bacterium]|nr:Crp/Fnr family transcriptional regulator [Bacteroidota bacterium]
MALNKIRDCVNCLECDIRSPLFRNLTPEDQAVLNQERFVVKYQPGELIYKQGSSFTHVIILISGLVKSYMEGKNSKDLILRISKPVELIIGPGQFVDGKHHNSAMALVPVEACYIAVNNYKEVIRRNPLFAEDVIRDISFRNLFSFKRMITLTQKQVPGRVAEALLYFSNDIYGSTTFDLNLSRQELADFCGVTKESAIRVLKDLKAEGSIRVEGNHFDLIDPQMIQKISELG